jgi:predicted alpha/beta hydrolase
MEIHQKPIEIIAKDGRKLSGWLVAPEEVRLSVLISSAVAIPKERYVNFAIELAGRGAAVLVYDYRAQAASVRGDIRKDLATPTDWGRLDMDAAIRQLDHLYPELPMAAVEHSVGAWVLGLCEHQHRISRHAFVCAGWGYVKLKPLPFRLLEQFFWHVYGPLCIKLRGHIPKGGLWKGEAINPKFFAEWKAWCHTPMCTPELLAGGKSKPQFFAKVRAPIRSFAYDDDPITNRRTVPRILALYPESDTQAIWAAPKDHGLERVGHEGLFSRKARQAWEPVFDWIAPAE